MKSEEHDYRSQPPAVRTMNLSVIYGQNPAFQDLDIEIPVGSYTAIMGPNGSGKTSLIKTILGLQNPATGSVSVFGLSPRRVNGMRIGYVPQIKTMDRNFPALAGEVVLSGKNGGWPVFLSRAKKNEAHNALERVGAGHLAHRSISELSGGELQRVFLARSFHRKPDLIVLDEPATGVDQEGEKDIYRILESFQKENRSTIIMATHDADVARHHADRVLLLNRRLIGFGKPHNVLTEECLERAFGHKGHHHGMTGECGA